MMSLILGMSVVSRATAAVPRKAQHSLLYAPCPASMCAGVRGSSLFCRNLCKHCPWLLTLRTKWIKIINKDPASASSQSWLPWSLTSLVLLWHCGPLGLPQVVMDCECIHADGHGLGWDQVKLLSV